MSREQRGEERRGEESRESRELSVAGEQGEGRRLMIRMR
jgi:hypothetical protein